MRYSDIKVGNVYFIDLNPVLDNEFGGNHLGMVLSKGHDQRTVTIVSLTSNSSGVGVNKINIGVIPSLPPRLGQDRSGNPRDSFIVLDQVRTVAVRRVKKVFDGIDANGDDLEKDCPLIPSVFNNINRVLASSTISNIDNDEVIWTYHKDSFIDFSVKKMINLTYAVIKDQNQGNESSELKYLYNAVKAVNDDFSIGEYLNENDVKYKVSETLMEIVNTSKLRV